MSPRRFALVVFAVAFLARLAIALAWPGGGGDTKVYLKVAENILSNGCVSLSDPATGACVPHWGGNQLPGYPAFVALVWALTGHSNTAVLVAQAAVNALAIAYLGVVLFRWLDDPRSAAIAVGIVALSPIGLPWSRFFLTEGTSHAITIWITVELLRSFVAGRLRILPLGIAFAAAVFVRYDNVMLAVPIAVAAFAIHGTVDGFRRGLIAALIAAIPLGAWWARSVAAGLPAMPPFGNLPDGDQIPRGYTQWGFAWTINEYEGPLWIHPIYSKCYSCIVIPERAHGSEEERRAVEMLLARLSEFDGQAIPEEIDAAFDEIATRRRGSNQFRHHVTLPFLRALWLWTGPINSTGWPIEMVDAANRYGFSPYSLVTLAAANPGETLIRGTAAVYRVLLICGSIVLLTMWRRGRREAISLVCVGMSYALAQIAFHAGLGLTETRYIIGSALNLEGLMVASVAFVATSNRRHATNKTFIECSK